MRRICILTMITLLFSFSCAADVLDYTSAGDTLIVIGEDATAEDVISSTELATSTHATDIPESQLSALVDAGVFQIPDGWSSTVYIAGDAVQLTSSADKLEAGERLGHVKPFVSGSDTPSLASTTLTTPSGTTKYNQYLRFETTTDTTSSDYIASATSLPSQNDRDEIAAYLIFTADTRMFEYELEFEDGLSSVVECINDSSSCTSAQERKLSGFEGLKLKMLGSDFMIMKARATTDSNSIELDLIGDGISTLLEEGETKVIQIDGKDYEIGDVLVSDDLRKVKFSINGLSTKELTVGNGDKMADDLYIGVMEVLPNEAGEASSGDLVRVLIGKKKIEFKDTDYSDNTVYENININGEAILGSEVKIKASLDSDVLKISSIKYRLKAMSNTSNTIYLLEQDTLSSHLKYPAGMLTDNWDLAYYGANPDGIMFGNPLNFLPHSDQSYTLQFVNNEDLMYDIPFVDNSNEYDKGFRYGDSYYQLRFFECMNTSDFCLEAGDSIVLTKGSSEDAVSRIVTYETIDDSEKTVSFYDPATDESFTTTYSGTEGTDASGTIVVGRQTHTFYVGDSPDYNITIDQNDDGDVNNDEVNIVIKGGGIMDLGPNQTCDQTSGLDSFNLTITIPVTNFEENGWFNTGLPEVGYLTVNEESSNKVDMDMTVTTTGFGKFKFPHDNAYFGGTLFGGAGFEDDDPDKSDYIKLVYPERQIFIQVYVTFGPTEMIPLSLTSFLGPSPAESGLKPADPQMMAQAQEAFTNFITSVTVGSAAPANQPQAGETVKLDSQVTQEELEAKPFVILLGGPCVNDHVKALADVGLTRTCKDWQEMEGKGILQNIETDFGPALIIAGYSGKDTIGASDVLTNTSFRDLLLGKDIVYTEKKGDEFILS